jgi:hypothetical protein
MSSNLKAATSIGETDLSTQGLPAFGYSKISLPASSTCPTCNVRGYSTTNFNLYIRHEQDPYVSASLLTAGCSSCTNTKAPKYPRGECGSNNGSQCFGLTPEQKRTIALYMMILGGMLLVFPCCFYHCVVKRMMSSRKVNQSDYTQKLNNEQQHGFAPQQPQPQASAPAYDGV